MPPPLGPCDQQTGMRLDERRRRFPGARRLRSQSGGGPGRGAPAEAQRVVCEQLHPGVQQHVGRVAEPRAGRVLARAAGADRRARQRAQRAQRAAVAAAAARRRRALEARRAVHRRRGRQRPGGAAHCSARLFACLHQVPKAPLAKRVTSPTQCHRPATRGWSARQCHTPRSGAAAHAILRAARAGQAASCVRRWTHPSARHAVLHDLRAPPRARAPAGVQQLALVLDGRARERVGRRPRPRQRGRQQARQVRVLGRLRAARRRGAREHVAVQRAQQHLPQRPSRRSPSVTACSAWSRAASSC